MVKDCSASSNDAEKGQLELPRHLSLDVDWGTALALASALGLLDFLDALIKLWLGQCGP